MPGDIKPKYGTVIQLTQTNLDGIASSSTHLSGWTSAVVNNATELAEDFLLSGQFQVESAGLSAGVILVLVYASFNQTPTWPDLFSAGTEGAEGTATIHDTEIRDSAFHRAAAIVTDTTASRIYPFAGVSIRDLFGSMPTHFAIFVAQSTGTTLETTGDPNQLYLQPVLSQYT